MTYAIIQYGYGLFGTGETLEEAIQEANEFLDTKIESKDDLKNFSHGNLSDGDLIFTDDQDLIDDYQE